MTGREIDVCPRQTRQREVPYLLLTSAQKYREVLK